MALKDDVLNGLKQLSQDDLKAVLASGILLIQNPEKGIGTALFDSVFHIVPQPCVELLVVDKIGQPSQMLLTRRPEDASTYAGRIHCPGTYIRKGEGTEAAIERCARRELGPEVRIFDLQASAPYNNPSGCAGVPLPDGRPRHTVGLVYKVQISGPFRDGVQGRWTDSIPSDLLPYHQEFVKDALGWESADKPLFPE